MNTSLVTIIVPCYNQAQYLDEALQSVIEQTYENWECIIVNDGSPDNTEEVALKWCKNNLKFQYLFQENSGLSSARNFGIQKAKGEFILPLDADDKISKDYVALALAEFEKDLKVKVVYCQAEKFGEATGRWKLEPFSLLNLARYNMIFCTALFRKSDWELAGGYDVNMIYGLEDWEFWIAILKNGGGVKCIDLVGFYYRIRNKSMARIINQEERVFSENYVTKKHIEFFISNYDVLNKDKKKLILKIKRGEFVANFFAKLFFNINFLRRLNK